MEGHKFSAATRHGFLAVLTAWLLLAFSAAWAEDTPESRATLRGLSGVAVFVEELQPNVQKYARKAGLERGALQQEVERHLREQGVAVLTYDQWLRTPGQPFLYVNVNTHETERYWYAYDIKVEVRQGAVLEADRQARTMVITWGVSMTGMANIGNLPIIKKDVLVMVHKFVEAWQAAHRGR